AADGAPHRPADHHGQVPRRARTLRRDARRHRPGVRDPVRLRQPGLAPARDDLPGPGPLRRRLHRPRPVPLEHHAEPDRGRRGHVHAAADAAAGRVAARLHHLGAGPERHLGALDLRASRRLHQGCHRHQAHRLLRQHRDLGPVPDRAQRGQRTVARVENLMFGRIANILGWAGVALVLAGVATWLVRDDLVTLRQGFAIGGLVCILIYAANQWREMGATFANRQARYGALAVASVIVVVALLVGLNYLASKYSKRWDL